MPCLRTSVRRAASLCASQIGIGMSVVGLVARVAEHHALVAGADLVVVVAGALALLERLVDTHRDVGRLLVDRDDDAARLAVDAERGVGVADLADRVARQAREVDVRLGADLARDDAQAGRDHRLAGDPAVRVLLQDRVEHRVADLVRHLVGVAFGDRLRREGVLGHSAPSCDRGFVPGIRDADQSSEPGGESSRDRLRRVQRSGRRSLGERRFRQQRQLLHRAARRRAGPRGSCRPRSRRRAGRRRCRRSGRGACGAACRRRGSTRSSVSAAKPDQHLARPACPRRGRRGSRGWARGRSRASRPPSWSWCRSAPSGGNRPPPRPSR